ncbi:MAG TPA: FecR domain-containing protein, partial [Gammaproteobacteria bacterium]
MLLLAASVCVGSFVAPASADAQTCDDWNAAVISLEGTVELRRSGQPGWQPARIEDVLCPGDSVSADDFSRAAIRLPDGTTLRLDQSTTLTLSEPPSATSNALIELLRGAINVLSRDPRSLRITTPFANAGTEGTEFVVEVAEDRTAVTVFEGIVTIDNGTGVVRAAPGERVESQLRQPPTVQAVQDLVEAVPWALYYEPVLDHGTIEPEQAPTQNEREDPSFFTMRASSRLAVGRVAEARDDLEMALRLNEDHVEALALQAVIALARNDVEQAVEL